MDLKLIEDLVALRRCGSYVRASQERHITHPAFGRRIRSLEAWAGVPLVEPGRAPVRLTAAGVALLAEAEPMLQALSRVRTHCQALSRPAAAASQMLRVGTGRTLAHTVAADWLARMRGLLRSHRAELHTGSMADVAVLFERGEVDLLCCYEHPALSINLSGQRFRHLALDSDRLVPVSRSDASGRVWHGLDSRQWIAYAPTLALGRLLEDHMSARRETAMPPPFIVCDSADAMLELAAKGMGLAWLPASLAGSRIRQGVMKVLGGRADQIHFEVRLYRPKARQPALVEAIWDATNR